jgi:hypothetical protein
MGATHQKQLFEPFGEGTMKSLSPIIPSPYWLQHFHEHFLQRHVTTWCGKIIPKASSPLA